MATAVGTAERVELDYQWINGPDCDPDYYCALVTPRVIKSGPPSNRRKKGQRIRKPVVAVEPAPNRLALTVPEAAWLLNCSPNTVWGLIGTKELASFTLGRSASWPERPSTIISQSGNAPRSQPSEANSSVMTSSTHDFNGSDHLPHFLLPRWQAGSSRRPGHYLAVWTT